MLVDQHGRTVDYLRISITEACNFRCQYCMPETPEERPHSQDLLGTEPLKLFIALVIEQGIKKIRLTGGEPLLREDLPELIAHIKACNPEVTTTLTTNAFLLEEKAQELKEAGLQRINISLDSISETTFRLITKNGDLNRVLRGIDESLRVGLGIKVNMVPLQGMNEQEIIPMLEFCDAKGIRLRYIEYMENTHAFAALKGLSGQEIIDRIEERYRVLEAEDFEFGPARHYRTEKGYTFGIIQPHSDNFCETCNRIRLTSDGKLIPCLYFEDALSVKPALEAGDSQKVLELLYQTLAEKPEKNRWSGDLAETSSRAFYQTGG